ncbi:MAG TPA: chemotaxis protein CheX [Bacillota bacterium]|nr:chemotaxis protein CheX [Bacillota bacterium]
MKVEYINPFIEASESVIEQLTGLKPKLGKVAIKSTPYSSDSLVIFIGVTGMIKGNVVMSFDPQVAVRIVSSMMGGMEVDINDELGKSAVGEVGNMIMGHTAMIFSEREINIDISPPTILVGKNMQVSNENGMVIRVPVLFENGDTMFTLDVSYK